MSREYRPEPNPSEKPVDPEYRTWKDVERFFEENRKVLQDRIHRQLIGFSQENAVLSFRTLEAALELGIIPRDQKEAFLSTEIPSESGPDTTWGSKQGVGKTLREKLSDDMQLLDEMISETLGNKNQAVYLQALGWLSDRIAFNSEASFEPEMNPETLEILLRGIEAEISGGTENGITLTKEQTSSVLHTLATFIRTGLLRKIHLHKELLPNIRNLALHAIYDKLRELQNEIARDPANSEDLKKDRPHALYGLFLLSDIKTIREYAESNTDEHTP